MTIKARIIEIGSDGHHPYVRLHVPEIKDVRKLGRNLYEFTTITLGSPSGGTIEELEEELRLAKKRLTDLVDACIVRKVPDEWPAIAMVIESFKGKHRE